MAHRSLAGRYGATEPTGVDHNAAIRLLKGRLAQIPNVKSDPVIFLATVIEERRRTEQTGPGRSHRRVILDILHQTNWRIEGPKGAALILESTPIRCARV
jgi:hypothetical protein